MMPALRSAAGCRNGRGIFKSPRADNVAMGVHDNPFNPGCGAAPPYMAGRRYAIDAFESMMGRIRDGQAENILVHGLRGAGKTVLMDRFSKMCVCNDLVPIRRARFDKSHCDPAEFARALKRCVGAGIEAFSRLDKAGGQLAAGSRRARKGGAGDGAAYYEPPYRPDGPVPYEEHLKDYLVKNWEMIEKSGYRGAVLLFDEFHPVLDAPKRSWYVLSDFVGVLADVQTQGCGYFAVFSGLPTLRRRIGEARSYSERMFRTLDAARLGPEDSKKAVSEPLRESRYSFSPDLVCQVAEDSGGWPYFLQFICREIISNAAKARIALDDYARMRKMIVARLDGDFYDPRVDALGCGQRQVLAAMSKIEGDDIPVSKVGQAAGLGRAGLHGHLARLEENGMVYRRGRGTYRFSLPLLREYMRRRAGAANSA